MSRIHCSNFSISVRHVPIYYCFPLATSSAALSLQLYKCHESVAQQSSLDPLVDVNVVERTRHELEVVVGPDRLL